MGTQSLVSVSARATDLTRQLNAKSVAQTFSPEGRPFDPGRPHQSINKTRGPLSVSCPKCGAQAGQYCAGLRSGSRAHSARWAAFDRVRPHNPYSETVTMGRFFRAPKKREPKPRRELTASWQCKHGQHRYGCFSKNCQCECHKLPASAIRPGA